MVDNFEFIDLDNSHILAGLQHYKELLAGVLLFNSLSKLRFINMLSSSYCPNLVIIIWIVVIKIMSQIEVVQNTFDNSNLRTLTDLIKMTNFDQPRQKIAEQLSSMSPKQYLWAIANNPAYFIQYQVKSAAIFKVKGHALIVWKPKYIEYPTMIVFPDISDKKPNSMKTQIDENSTTTQQTTNLVVEYLQKFYGTYFYSDPAFETNLVTFCKHFVSKISKHSYWHVLLEDTGKMFLTQTEAFDNILKIRISGIKEGYDKTLVLFSFKGKRENIFTTAKNKWMQVTSFLAMILIFYSVVACPSSGPATGICQYRSQMTLCGAGMMLALLGVRYGQKSADKKNRKKKATKEHQKDQ